MTPLIKPIDALDYYKENAKQLNKLVNSHKTADNIERFLFLKTSTISVLMDDFLDLGKKGSIKSANMVLRSILDSFAQVYIIFGLCYSKEQGKIIDEFPKEKHIKTNKTELLFHTNKLFEAKKKYRVFSNKCCKGFMKYFHNLRNLGIHLLREKRVYSTNLKDLYSKENYSILSNADIHGVVDLTPKYSLNDEKLNLCLVESLQGLLVIFESCLYILGDMNIDIKNIKFEFKSNLGLIDWKYWNKLLDDF